MRRGSGPASHLWSRVPLQFIQCPNPRVSLSRTPRLAVSWCILWSPPHSTGRLQGQSSGLQNPNERELQSMEEEG